MADDDAGDLPYRSEYAKSGRASCKTCKAKIDKGELRLAAMVQVSFSISNHYSLKDSFRNIIT